VLPLFPGGVERARARRLNDVTPPAALKMDLARQVKHARPRDLFARA
jgi:hypothetical protein